jgi:hypothetical protein
MKNNRRCTTSNEELDKDYEKIMQELEANGE